MVESAPSPSARSLLARGSRLLLAGGVLGLLVGGIGGRLAMMLIARLNPEATGQVSDDGFVIGRTTMSGTLNLLVVGTLLGIVGAVIYGALRPLRFGPRWFQGAAATVGPAVVVGSILIQDGVDFTVLTPVWLSITLFVAIPGLYGGLLWAVTERWQPGGDYRLQPPVAWVCRAALGFIVVLGTVALAGDFAQFA